MQAVASYKENVVAVLIIKENPTMWKNKKKNIMEVIVYHSKQPIRRLTGIFICQWVIGGPLIEMHDDLASWLVQLLGGLAVFEGHLSFAETNDTKTKLYYFLQQLLRI